MRIKHAELLSGAQSGDDKFEQLVIITVEALYINFKDLVIINFKELHTITKIFYCSINTI